MPHLLLHIYTLHIYLLHFCVCSVLAVIGGGQQVHVLRVWLIMSSDVIKADNPDPAVLTLIIPLTATPPAKIKDQLQNTPPDESQAGFRDRKGGGD